MDEHRNLLVHESRFVVCSPLSVLMRCASAQLIEDAQTQLTAPSASTRQIYFKHDRRIKNWEAIKVTTPVHC